MKWEKDKKFLSDLNCDITVTNIQRGVDAGNRNLNFKIDLVVNGKKIVIHAYNGKQKLTVSGKEHATFVKKLLCSYFADRISWKVF